MKTATQNNDKPATVVQTYLVDETKVLIYDNDALDRWKALCVELGLQGQQTLTQVADKSPNPFLHCKPKLVEAFKVLCPRKDEATKYSAQPIPLEVLDLLALSKREGYFQRLEIWYDDEQPDPLAIGITCDYIPLSVGWNGHREGQCKTTQAALQWLVDNGKTPYSKTQWYYETDEKHYLLARWGDMKKSFKTLIEAAKARYIDERATSLRKEIQKAQRELADIETDAEAKFGSVVNTNDLPF